VRVGCTKGCVVWNSLYVGIVSGQQFIGAILYPSSNLGISGAAVRRVVLESSILRRIMRRCDDDAVRKVLLAATVVDKDGSGDDWRRSYAVLLLIEGLHVVGCENLDCRASGWCGKRVRVFTYIKRAVGTLAMPVIANGLRDSQNMVFGKGAI